MIRKFFCFLIIYSVSLLVTTPKIFAAINISALPMDGGTSLDFGRLNNPQFTSKEIRIRITSSDGKQYQVFHRVLESFTNQQGLTFNNNAFLGYTLTNSNTLGALYTVQPTPILNSDSLLYSSTQDGQSDTFTLIYDIDLARAKTTGSFVGKVIFTARPIGGGAEETAILNVLFSITGELKIESKTSRGNNQVQLRVDQNRNELSDEFAVSVHNDLSQKLQVSLNIDSLPRNEQQEEFPKDILKLSLESKSTNFSNFQDKNYLRVGEQNIGIIKDNATEFSLIFNIESKHLLEIPAGKYNGVVKIIFDDGINQKTVDCEIAINVEKIFALKISSENNSVNFNDIVPESPPQIKEIVVEVQSNIHKPYLVSQSAIAPLTNENGDPMPKEFFTMKGELLENSKGKIVQKDFVEVPSEDAPVFYSNSDGESAKFKLFLKLSPVDASISAGNYQTSFKYSLGEI